MLDRDRGTNKSAIYKEVARLTGRSRKAAEFKVRNVSFCDPRTSKEKPVKGSENYQELLYQLFKKYGLDHETLDRMYEGYEGSVALTGKITSGKENYSPEPRGYYSEGGRSPRTVNGNARSRALAVEARKRLRKEHGNLSCCVCGTSFDGLIARNGLKGEIIEIHHLQPIEDLDGPRKIALERLLEHVVPVCPVCHSLIHIGPRALTPTEVREILNWEGSDSKC
jgi:predicted HNH restriction endonuclease